MSGFVRTLEKRILKRKGYVRQTSEIRKDEFDKPYIHHFAKGEGPIINANGESTKSSRWPRVTEKRKARILERKAA